MPRLPALMLRKYSLTLALVLVPACTVPGSGSQASGASRSSGMGKQIDPGEELTQAVAGQAKLRRDLEAAELDLRLETLEAEAQRVEAALKVQTAQRSTYAARDALASYREVESAKEREAVQLLKDRSVSRVESQRADLDGILEIYRDEQEARAKDEIIRRHRQSLAFAERELEQARAQARLVLEFEVPRKTEKLEWALAKAEAEQAAAERAQERAEMKGRLSVTRKETSIADLKAKLEANGRKQTKLRSEQGGGQ